MPKIIPIEIYTDGSCIKQTSATNFGGWAFLIHKDGKILTKNSGSTINSTNQRMELTAAAEALKSISDFRKENEDVLLYSDSAYLTNCWSQRWYENWLKNGWRNAKKEPVANQELWFQIIPFFNFQYIKLIHVKGHSTSVYNNMVDEMAVAASKKEEEENVRRSKRKGILISVSE